MDRYDDEDLDVDYRSEILRDYFYGCWIIEKAIEKSWDDLTRWEVDQVERDFEAYLQDQERLLDPEKYYCIAGTR